MKYVSVSGCLIEEGKAGQEWLPACGTHLAKPLHLLNRQRERGKKIILKIL